MNLTRILTLATLLAVSASGFAQKTTDDYQQQMQELKAMVEKLQSELKKVRGSRDELQSELEASESEIGELQKNIDKIQKQLKAQQDELSSLNRERDRLKKAKRGQQAQIAGQVEAAYRLGRQSNIKLLLNQQSPQQVSRMLKYYDYFLDARAHKIDTYVSTIAELNRIEPAIVDKTNALSASRNKLQLRHRSLRDKQAQRSRTLAKLNASIASKDQQLAKMNADRARLQKLLDQVAEAIASLPAPDGGIAFSKRRGKLDWPTRGRIRHNFGSSREGTSLKWDGVVIEARAGTEVRAVHGGRVIFSDYLRGHGLLTIIDHGDGYMSLYAYNQSLYRDTGDWVESGEVIATVGASGGRARAGLYFEIRHNGRPSNPKKWLKRA